MATVPSYGMLGSIGYTPGNIIAMDATDSWGHYTQLPQQLWCGNTATTNTGSGLSNLLGQLGQAELSPVKKAMSFVEELREEISNWHGSLGVI